MKKYSNFPIDTEGNVQVSVTVTVKIAGSGTNATLFSDNVSTSKSNPFTSLGTGEIAFYAANGRYDVIISTTPAVTDSDVLLFDLADDYIRSEVSSTTKDLRQSLQVTGHVEVIGSAGNIDIQLAQTTSHASDLTVARGSWARWVRIL